MVRDYKKEAAWAKSKYKELRVKVDPKTAEDLIKKLDGKPYSDFIKEKITEFLNE